MSKYWNDRLRHAPKDLESRNDEWGSQATLVTVKLNNTLRELKCSVSMAARENVPNTLCQNVLLLSYLISNCPVSEPMKTMSTA